MGCQDRNLMANPFPLEGEGQGGGMANERARNLRKTLTEAEKALWCRLRLRQIAGHRFRRQVPIGDYIADFVCLEKRIIIEVDGGQHAERMVNDLERTDWLKSQRFNVLRFWNHQVLQEIESVLEIIENELKSSPARGEEGFLGMDVLGCSPSPLAGEGWDGGQRKKYERAG